MGIYTYLPTHDSRAPLHPMPWIHVHHSSSVCRNIQAQDFASCPHLEEKGSQQVGDIRAGGTRRAGGNLAVHIPEADSLAEERGSLSDMKKWLEGKLGKVVMRSELL